MTNSVGAGRPASAAGENDSVQVTHASGPWGIGPRTVLVRGTGPKPAAFGVSGAAPDPSPNRG